MVMRRALLPVHEGLVSVKVSVPDATPLLPYRTKFRVVAFRVSPPEVAGQTCSSTSAPFSAPSPLASVNAIQPVLQLVTPAPEQLVLLALAHTDTGATRLSASLRARLSA